MPGKIFHDYLASTAEPVNESEKLWRYPLPGSPVQNPGACASDDGVPTYGDYFTAVHRFLEAGHYGAIVRALSLNSGISYSTDSIYSIHIFLVKHGAFYHPGRVEIWGQVLLGDFVVNVAVSNSGKSVIQREFDLLQRLNVSESAGFLPMVYECADITLENHAAFKMFLAQWWDGFHEFHMALDPEDHRFKLRVWDPDRRIGFLSREHTLELYRQIAVILTTYYNPESFEQIFPWHHAAGDFVVHCSGSGVEVRLITVRQYAAMYVSDAANDDACLEAMLLFLVNLSIRTRIDRLDGVGDFVWAEDTVVDATVQGFLECMAKRYPEHHHMFRQYVQVFQIHEFCEAVTGSYNPCAPELPLILEHIADHAMQLQEALSTRL
jgi:hypothetical protein